MKPADNITPTAEALIIKKISLWRLRAGTIFPRSGMQTPIALATTIDRRAAILHLSRFGSTRKIRIEKVKNWLLLLNPFIMLIVNVIEGGRAIYTYREMREARERYIM